MKIRLLAACALLVCGAASAHPVVVESRAELPFESDSVAHAGNELIAMHWTALGPGAGGVPEYRVFASLYTRVNGQWQYTRDLVSEVRTDFINDIRVAMTQQYAAIAMPSGIRIFERTSAGWIPAEFVDLLAPLERVIALDVHGQTILAAQAENLRGALVIDRQADGTWETNGFLDLPDDGLIWNRLDLDEDRAILPYQHPSGASLNNVRIFERDSRGNWFMGGDVGAHRAGVLEFGPFVAIHDSLALVSGEDEGAHVLVRSASGVWSEAGHLRNPGAGRWDQARTIQISDQYVFMTSDNEARRMRTGYLHRRIGNARFEHVATFAGDEDHSLYDAWLDVNRVIALTGASGNLPLEFTLPADFSTPPLVLHDFETGADGAWTPLPGGYWAFERQYPSDVYRQANVDGDATALHAADDVDQSISADVTIQWFNGADRWVGLITRYVDESNYYYLTLRDSNRVEIRRMRNGIFDVLATAPIDVAVGQSFNLRLESSGTFHTAYVDGQLVLRAWDDTHAHGRRGLRMYKASIDFDNVVVSPGPTAEMVHARIQKIGGTWVDPPDRDNRRFSQTSLAGDARRVSGNPRVNHSVQALITIDSFAATGSPWVGLMARYVDVGNYYYVTVRKNNVLSLRKLTNGAITEVLETSLTVTPGTPFVLRLDAIRGHVAAYVNGVFKLEMGADEVAGQVGVMTYRAAARVEAYTANEL